jgi:hypothetical protein
MSGPKKIGIALIVIALFFLWKGRPISHPAGILIKEAPEQVLVAAEARKPIKLKDRILEPLAHYKIRARVLATERYWMDPGASVSPIDLALGWGPMSDSKILNDLSISQSLRYYHVRWGSSPPITEAEIMHHSANAHIIPANDYIKSQITALRVGSLVELEGDLVMVSDKSGGEWKSSLTREDTGNGACELMRVTSVRNLF